MHIEFHGSPFNARDSDRFFSYMYEICKNTKCEDCQFGEGKWVDSDDGNKYLCEIAVVKQLNKQRTEQSGNQ